MGELVGLPEWLVQTLFVVGGLALYFGYAWRSRRESEKRLLTKRENPTREEFNAMLEPECGREIAEWFWQHLADYYAPLTPHPDDHLIDDVLINGDDIDMDWVPQFCKHFGIGSKKWEDDWPPWPDGEALTVRSFARYLASGRAART